jgi:hypothetical protein
MNARSRPERKDEADDRHDEARALVLVQAAQAVAEKLGRL